MVSEDSNRELDPWLAQALHRALTADSEELYQILRERDRDIVHAALKNPNLGVNHLLALLKRNDLDEEIIRKICKRPDTHESHQVKVALVHNPKTPGPIVSTILPHLYLFELVAVCYLPGATPDQKVAAERAIIQRLPETPLGNKLTLARRGTATVVEALLKEGHPQLLEACLDNPHLKESSLYQYLNSAHATAETISVIARHARWKARPNLRLAMLKNQRTPAVWYTQFLPSLSSSELHNLAAARKLGPIQKDCIESELNRRRKR